MKTTYTLEGIPFVIADLIPFAEKEFLISRIEVKRDLRGRGYGRELLHRIIKDAEAEAVTLHLSVDPDHSIGSLSREELAAWYRRHGFTEIMDPNDPFALTRLAAQPTLKSA